QASLQFLLGLGEVLQPGQRLRPARPGCQQPSPSLPGGTQRAGQAAGARVASGEQLDAATLQNAGTGFLRLPDALIHAQAGVLPPAGRETGASLGGEGGHARGGGIFNAAGALLTVTHSVLSNNQAVGGDGGPGVTGGEGAGGGIYNLDATLAV